MAQGRSTKIIAMIEWIRTSRLSIKKSLSVWGTSLSRPPLSDRLNAADPVQKMPCAFREMGAEIWTISFRERGGFRNRDALSEGEDHFRERDGR